MAALIHETTKFPEDIYEAMRFASYAMYEEGTRYYLMGLHFDARGKDGLWLLATDGHRMHATKLKNSDVGTFKWRIGPKDARAILAAMRAKKVRAKTPLRIDFSAGSIEVGAARYKMETGAQDFTRIMPRTTDPLATFSATTDLKDFLAAAKTLGRGRALKVERNDSNSVTLSAKAYLGPNENQASISACLTKNVSAADNFAAVGINPGYLADVFAALGWGYVSMLGDPTYPGAPLQFERRTTNGPERMCIMGPMRI